MSAVFLFLAAFLASAVEMVEALTIVLAVGVTRGWRSALAAQTAHRMGLGPVAHIAGGFGAWRKANGPLEAPAPKAKST